MNGTRLRPVPRPRARSLALLILPFLLSCGGKAPIRIGLVGTFGDPLGLPQRYGAQLALKEINDDGGIDGRMLEFIEAEDFGDPDSAVNAAVRIAATDVVAVLGGSFSGPTIAAAPVLNDPANPVLQITPSGSSPAISSAGEWTFRLCPTDLAHAAALARFVRQTLRLERGAVIYMNNTYGRGFRDVFEREFAALGGRVVHSDPYLPDQVATAAPFIERIGRDDETQFILAASYEVDGSTLLRMARSRGITVPFLGGDGIEGIEREGPVAEGVYQSAAYLYNLNTATNTAWVAKYQAAYPQQPVPNQTAVASYDGVHLLAQLIREVGTDRRKLRDALAEVGTTRPAYDGVSGRIAFDSLGDVPEKQVLIAQARSGIARAVEGTP